MARRKKKKEKKQHLKEEKFRDTMLEIGKWVKEYRYPLLLGIAVVAILFVLLSMRAERRENLLTYAHNVLRRESVAGPKDLKDLAQKMSGDPIEPWVLLRLGTTLYDLYQKEDALTGDKGRLKEAKKSFEDVVARFPENGSAVFVAKKALEAIEVELSYKPDETVKDAFDGPAIPRQRQAPPPRKTTPRVPAPRKTPPIKKPVKTPEKPAPEVKPPVQQIPPPEKKPASEKDNAGQPPDQPGSSEPKKKEK